MRSGSSGGTTTGLCGPTSGDTAAAPPRGAAAPPSAPRAGLARAVRTLWRRGGVGAFYAGLAPSTARAVLVTTSRLVAYEHVRGWFDAPR